MTLNSSAQSLKGFNAAISSGKKLGVVMLMRQFYPLNGGYQNQALGLATELKKHGLHVMVVTQRLRGLSSYEVYQGIPIHRVFVYPSGFLAAWSYLGSAFFWMLRNRNSFQIIHANRSSSGLIAGVIGFLLHKQVLYKLTRGDEIDVKGLGAAIFGRLKASCLRLTVKKFVSLTAQTEKDLLALGISKERIARIPNGIHFENRIKHYDRDRIRAQFSWGPEEKVVTFVGRLSPDKGVDWLLEVWKIVSDGDRRARLLIIGDGPDRQALMYRAGELGIQDSVKFVGRQEDVYLFFAASDVFVLPSRLEGMSNALLEAMSQGLPVVAGDDELGGNRSVISDQQDGFLVSLGDNGTFAQRLLALLTDDKFRSEMGRRARQKVETAFTVETVTRHYLQIYRELLGTT